MKKLTFPLFLLGFVLVTIFGILAYVYYVEPLYSQNVGIQKTVKLDSKIDSLVVFKRPEQKKVFSFELELSGNTRSNFGLRLSDGKEVKQDARIKGGDVSFTYVGDWYADSAILYFFPEKNEKGKLTINARFITL